MRASGVLPPSQEERRIAQEYRQIKRPLIANAFGRGATPMPNGHLIMLASALPGDGKTFTSVNLALSHRAREGRSHRCWSTPTWPSRTSAGPSACRTSRACSTCCATKSWTWSRVILAPTCRICRSCRRAGHPTRRPSCSRARAWRDVVARLGAADPNASCCSIRRRCCSPPNRVRWRVSSGQVVLVVGAGSTPQKAVLDAIELLGEGKRIGLVLNQCDEGSAAAATTTTTDNRAEAQEAS